MIPITIPLAYMLPAHRRHDQAWSLLEPHLPGRVGQWGRVAKDNRSFINAVSWILRTGAPWRDLPLRVLATAATQADCTQAATLIEAMSAEPLIGDKGYDSNALLAQARAQGMQAHIPPRKKRNVQRDYDRH